MLHPACASGYGVARPPVVKCNHYFTEGAPRYPGTENFGEALHGSTLPNVPPPGTRIDLQIKQIEEAESLRAVMSARRRTCTLPRSYSCNIHT